MSSYNENLTPINKLSVALFPWLDEKTCHEYFIHICDEYDNTWKKKIKSNHWQKSKVRILLQVHERLLLTDKLDEEAHHESIQRYLYPPLIEYLRLTCFDQLGQPNEWMTFDNWLSSKKKASERKEIVDTIHTNDKVDISKELFKGYQLKYGVKNSFYTFLNNILPPQNLTLLLSKIKYRVHNESSSSIITEDADNHLKANYLFNIRNRYTHNTYAKAPLRGFKSRENSEWHFRETLYKDQESHWISTHSEFENELKNCVLVGIAEIIKNEHLNS